MKKSRIFFFSFRGAWQLFVFTLVASLLCLSPHCVLAMKCRRIVKGLVALAGFYILGLSILTEKLHPSLGHQQPLGLLNSPICSMILESLAHVSHYYKTDFQPC